MSGKNITKVLVLIVVVLLSMAGIMLMRDSSVQNGRDVIRTMYDRYSNDWYAYLTFRQETIFYKEGKEDYIQTWYEALSLPGRLVIKFDSLNSASGIVFRQDSQYVFTDNVIVRKTARVHDLMVLGFDVYGQPPEQTIQKLEGRDFDLDRIYETTWQGRPVYVVGAEGGGDMSPQFWIDKEHLYFVRLIRPDSEKEQLQETQFNNYQRIGGGWVAPEVVFKVDGEVVLREEYYDIASPASIPSSVFDVQNFRKAMWRSK